MKTKFLLIFACALIFVACNPNEPSTNTNGSTFGKGKFSVSETQKVNFMLSNTAFRVEKTGEKTTIQLFNLKNQYDCYFDDGTNVEHVEVDESNRKVTIRDKFKHTDLFCKDDVLFSDFYEEIDLQELYYQFSFMYNDYSDFCAHLSDLFPTLYSKEYNEAASAYFSKHQARVLSALEWRYVVFNRPDAGKLRSGASIKISNSEICGGLILLPDDCEVPSNISFYPNKKEWTINVYSLSEWKNLESLGAIFLPACATYNDWGGQGVVGDYMSCDGKRLYINSIMGNDVQNIFDNSCCRVVKDAK